MDDGGGTRVNQQLDTLVDLLQMRADLDPNGLAYTFLIDGEREGPSFTYATLDEAARAVAMALREHGIRPGDRALLVYPPSLDFIPAFFGCLYAGVIAVPAYPPQPTQASRTLPRLLSIIGDADVGIVLTNTAIAEGASSLRRHTAAIDAVPWLCTDRVDLSLASSWTPPRFDDDPLAFLQYTSGSTASPKGVMVSHRNLLHNLASANHAAENDESTVSVSWLPVIHDMGLIEGMLGPAYSGYPAYLMAPASFLQRPMRWLRAITRYRATTSGGPNFAYDLCVRKITDAQRAELDLSSWRIAYNGAEPIRRDTLLAFHDRFRGIGFRWRSFYPVYGLAESTLLVSTGGTGYEPVLRDADPDRLARGELRDAARPTMSTRPLVSSGPASFGTRIVIVDPETFEPCMEGRIGEIWVSSPSVARGYWRREDETRETFGARLANGDGPFLRTGDLGLLSDGELFVTGRLKDLLIVRGLKHFPQDIELTAERQDDALRPGCSAAFAIDGEEGEAVGIALEVDPRALPIDPSEQQVRYEAITRAVRQAVSEHHGVTLSIVSLLPLGAMPKTSSGKLRRRDCRVAILNGSLDEVARWAGT
jgi:acyl-CoA synthetase (AMP-forming)/AMP-acid ligase II